MQGRVRFLECALLFSLAGLALSSILLNWHNSYNYYDAFLGELNNPRYAVYSVKGYLDAGPRKDKVNVILRHDVDFDIGKSIDFARMEETYGIRSSFYFRTRGPYNLSAYDPWHYKITWAEWLTWIHDNGFETGLHYEDAYLDKYNWPLAIQHFNEDITFMRSIVPIETVCSHGNDPNQRYWNGAMWNFTTLKAFGLEYDATLNFTGKSFKFYSDSNDEWQEWIQIVRDAQIGETLYLLIHPDWWHGFPW